MDSIIFLNYNQCCILNEGYIDISQLQIEHLQQVLTAVDYYNIIDYTKFLLQKDNLLYKLGFTNCNNENYAYTSSKYVDFILTDPLNAYYTSDNNIIICDNKICNTEVIAFTDKIVYKQTLYNIVKAMQKIKTFQEIKQTKQFELLILS